MRYYSVEDIVRSLAGAAEKLRSDGFRVGTGDLLVLASLLRSYASLEGRDNLSEDEFRIVAGGVLKNDRAVETLLEYLRSMSAGDRTREAAEKIEGEINSMLKEMGVAPGWRVTKRQVKQGKKGWEARKSLGYYLMLRRLGIIRGKPGRERVADPDVIRSIALRLARSGFTSVREAYENLAPRGGRDSRLMEAEARIAPNLATMSEGQLLQLGEATLRKGSPGILRRVAERIASLAINEGVRDAERAARLLRAAGVRDPRVDEALVLSDPKLAEKLDLAPETIARAAKKAPPEDATEIVARALRRMNADEARRLLGLVDPESLWSARRHPFKGGEASLFEAAVKAARSLREAVLYLETGNPGRRDMAEYLAGEALRALEAVGPAVSIGRVTPSAVRGLAEAAQRLSSSDGAHEAIDTVLYRVRPSEALAILRGLYRRAEAREERELLVQAAERLLQRLSSREGSRLLPKWVRSGQRGRVDVRSSTYRLARRLPQPIVYRRRLRARKITLLLDTSGSMLEHSAWAAAVAMLFSRNVERLVLFSQEPVVLEGPLKPRELARALLEAEFRGLTNISAALRSAANSSAKLVVLISDLKQTVAGAEPLYSVVSDLRRRGYRLVAVTPIGYDREAAEEFEAAGGRIIYSGSPRMTAVQLLRVLLRSG